MAQILRHLGVICFSSKGLYLKSLKKKENLVSLKYLGLQVNALSEALSEKQISDFLHGNVKTQNPWPDFQYTGKLRPSYPLVNYLNYLYF